MVFSAYGVSLDGARRGQTRGLKVIDYSPAGDQGPPGSACSPPRATTSCSSATRATRRSPAPWATRPGRPPRRRREDEAARSRSPTSSGSLNYPDHPGGRRTAGVIDALRERFSVLAAPAPTTSATPPRTGRRRSRPWPATASWCWSSGPPTPPTRSASGRGRPGRRRPGPPGPGGLGGRPGLVRGCRHGRGQLGRVRPRVAGRRAGRGPARARRPRREVEWSRRTSTGPCRDAAPGRRGGPSRGSGDRRGGPPGRSTAWWAMAERDGGVYVVGAGLAGPRCARRLHEKGVAATVLEASDGVGGRVRTDRVDDFLLDRGFQVLLTAYPEARDALDYRDELHPFYPGAMIRTGDRFVTVADPFRRRWDGLRTAMAPVRPRRQAQGGVAAPADHRRVAGGAVRPARDYDQRGPGGRRLRTRSSTASSGRCSAGSCSTGSRAAPAAVRVRLPDVRPRRRRPPDARHGRHPEQLAGGLPPGCVRLGQRVTAVGDGAVTLDGGEKLPARAVVVATDGPSASRLLGDDLPAPGRSRPPACISPPTAPRSTSR